MDAHLKIVVIPGHHELNVGPRRIDLRIKTGLPAEVESCQCQLVGQHHDRMRVADIYRDRSASPTCDVDPCRLVDHRGTTDVDGDSAIRLRPGGAQPGPSGDLHRTRGNQAELEQVAYEDAQPVTTHLGDRPVGVAVVHEPQCRVTVPFGDRGGLHCAKQPVATDSGPAVTQPAHSLGVQRVVVVGVQDQDEVVQGAVTFGEVQRRHPFSLSSGPSQAKGGHDGGCCVRTARGQPLDAVVAGEPAQLFAGEAACSVDGGLSGLVLTRITG